MWLCHQLPLKGLLLSEKCPLKHFKWLKCLKDVSIFAEEFNQLTTYTHCWDNQCVHVITHTPSLPTTHLLTMYSIYIVPGDSYISNADLSCWVHVHVTHLICGYMWQNYGTINLKCKCKIKLHVYTCTCTWVVKHFKWLKCRVNICRGV